jgi:hypothetical protein
MQLITSAFIKSECKWLFALQETLLKHIPYSCGSAIQSDNAVVGSINCGNFCNLANNLSRR